MVADSHPITHPPKTSRNVRRVASLAAVDTTARIIAHTAAHATLYAVYVFNRWCIARPRSRVPEWIR
jgi:hypothetical protein